jgi:prepilin-type N-terminal cleavage/methylation domain-containing protein/prepilin-type processing-associated H-X9-DG protein
MKAKGFTLIELLVVIAIIALLVSILLPSLSKAKEIAKATVCMHQLKEISVGMNFYLEREDQYFPMVVVQSAEEPVFSKRWKWQFALRDFCPFEGDWGGNNHSAQAAGLFHCPSDDFRLNVPGTGLGVAPASYGGNYHADCRWINRPDALAAGYVAKISSVARPSDKVYAIDSWISGGGYVTIYYGVPEIDPSSTNPYGIEFRHNDGAKALFMDWHVDTLTLNDTLGHPEWVYPLDK